MHRASRYRLYPNQTQERQFARLCGAGRFVYNELLAEQIREYGRFEAGERDRPGASEFDFGRRYARLKAQEGHEWLRELSAVVVRGTGAFFMECLVETANDPSTMQWNYRGDSLRFHT